MLDALERLTAFAHSHAHDDMQTLHDVCDGVALVYCTGGFEPYGDYDRDAVWHALVTIVAGLPNPILPSRRYTSAEKVALHTSENTLRGVRTEMSRLLYRAYVLSYNYTGVEYYDI